MTYNRVVIFADNDEHARIQANRHEQGFTSLTLVAAIAGDTSRADVYLTDDQARALRDRLTKLYPPHAGWVADELPDPDEVYRRFDPEYGRPFPLPRGVLQAERL